MILNYGCRLMRNLYYLLNEDNIIDKSLVYIVFMWYLLKIA